MNLVVVILALAVAAMAASDVPLRDQFDVLKVKAGRAYSSPDDEARHFAAFERNSQNVVEMNRRNPLAVFKLSLHNFDALPPAGNDSQGPAQRHVDKDTETSSYPSKLDWRTKGAVGPVYNDVYPACNGGNVVATVAGNVDGTFFVKNRLPKHQPFVPGSPEQLLDCASKRGCEGALVSDYYRWMLQKNNGEIATEASYPYNYWQGKCRTGQFPPAAKIKSFAAVAAKNETALTQYVARMGPIAAGVYAGHVIVSYQSGIITDCGKQGKSDNLSVLIVGYDDTHNPPYWILKNAFGTSWGEKGYFRVAKGRNVCSVADSPYTAIPADTL